MSYQRDIFDLIARMSGTGNILAVPRMFCEMTGSLESGVLLSQIIYWADKGSDPDGWFYKSYVEWYQDSFLSEYQVRKGVKAFEKAGLLETKLKKVQGSPTLHYRIKEREFSEWIMKNLGFETVKPKDELPNPQFPFHIYTETTAEITSTTTTTTRDREPTVSRRRQAGPEANAEAAPPEPAAASSTALKPHSPSTTTLATRMEGTQRTRQNDPAYDRICTLVENEGLGMLTPLLAGQIKAAMDKHPPAAIEKAIEIAVRQNKRFWAYVAGILLNMEREGYNYDKGQFNRERSGGHRGATTEESAETRRQRDYNERYTSLVADEINKVISPAVAAAGWAELEATFPGYEYRELPRVR